MQNKDIIKSIENEVKLLKKIIEEPSILEDNSIFMALRDQKSFSNYQNQDLCIRSYSLNSHKTYANKVLVEGYQYLDCLRKECISSFNIKKNIQLKKPEKKSLLSLSKKIKELKLENEIIKKHNLLLSALNNCLTEKLDFYVLNSKDNEVIYDYQDFKKQIECMVRFIDLEV